MSIKYHFLISTLFLLVISPLQAKLNGEQLYSTHCSACHGANGHGGVGVPLALPDFQYGVTNDYLEKTIRLGRPGRVMPAFTQLKDDEITAIIKHIRTWAPGKPFQYPNKKISGNLKKGKEIYATHCAACHGAAGEGGKGTGVTFSRPRNLPVIAPALNNPGFLTSAPDMMIKTVLMNGREGTPMPSFLKQGLSEKDIDDVVTYVRSFEKQMTKEEPKAEIAPLISFESPNSLEETVANIKRAVIGKNFVIIRQQYLNEGLAEAGKENKKQIIIYFCNFNFLNRALAIDPRVGLFLPCRITAIEENGKVTVTSTNPLFMSHFFNNKELDKLCEEMHQVYVDIVEESTF
ncbi:MAG: c-type cytochrome [Gammaproteobacteria bacterium]|nr:c-type cytochrome [Gammaproteobacteria bacterium]MCW8987812.1 c-type cytochrome [Gammaproteobacteria bacterium]